VASNRQCVTADDNRCIASGNRGDNSVIILYEKNFIIAVNARDVICPDVEDDRITAKKGPNNEGKSNVVISPRQQKQKSKEVGASTFAVCKFASKFGEFGHERAFCTLTSSLSSTETPSDCKAFIFIIPVDTTAEDGCNSTRGPASALAHGGSDEDDFIDDEGKRIDGTDWLLR
jgi:hypothetical protein